MRALVYQGPGKKSLQDRPMLISHHFEFDNILEAYETFGHAESTQALKVIINMI